MKLSIIDLRLIILAIIIRLLLMPFLYHPDLKTQYFHANFLGRGNLNIYQFLRQNISTLPYKDTFNYPPLTYYLQGSWAMMVSPLLGDNYQKWLFDWGETGFTSREIFTQLFVLKIPYLILDIIVGLTIWKILPIKRAQLGLIIWLFNPLSLYIIYGLSNFDILPVALSFLGYYFFVKQKYSRSAVFWGLSISTKLYPLLFVPFLVLVMYRMTNIKTIVKFMLTIAVVFLGFVIWQLPDFLSISNSGLVGLILEDVIVLPGNIHMPVFAIGYLLVLGAFFALKLNGETVILGILAVCFLIFGLSHYHAQWFLWGLPFLTLAITRHLRLIWLLLPIGLAFLVNLLSFHDNYLIFGLTSPLFPGIYQAGSIDELLPAGLNWGLLDSVAGVVMLICGFLVIMHDYGRNKE